jgi:UDP-N-acetylmuramyl tripeptide synthase
MSTIAELVRAAEPSEPKPLGDLLDRLAAEGRLRGARVGGKAIGPAALAGIRVRGVTHDSRAVVRDGLFVAIPGAHVDGHDFADAAVRAGASVVLVERPVDGDVSQVVVAATQSALATAAAWWYGDAARDLGVIGITGTDGKTTTSFLAVAALEAAGLAPGLVSTVATRIGTHHEDNAEHATTPDAPALQATLRAMTAAGNRTAVLETTSHGLALERVGGIAYDAAILTNVTHEHLEFHGTWERYRAAKLSLFERLAGPAKTTAGMTWPKVAIRAVRGHRPGGRRTGADVWHRPGRGRPRHGRRGGRRGRPLRLRGPDRSRSPAAQVGRPLQRPQRPRRARAGRGLGARRRRGS